MNTHIRPRKSLGQHFLRSKEALKKIVEVSAIAKGETVLEIGPGEGVLTEALLNAGARVVAIETDPRCVEKLHERFADAAKDKKFLLVTGDIRNTQVQQELFQKKFLGTAAYKLVANIPYYITGMLFRLFLEKLPASAGRRQPSRIVFLVQKEVAEQIVARDGKENIFSLAIKVYGTPHYVLKVKRKAFSPPPKVDSAIITISDISRTRLEKLADEEYFRIVKAGLGAKRKMLLGNLFHGLKIPKEKLAEIFQKLDIDEHIRGEDLAAEKWIALAEELHKAAL